jgi:hypothetical protein
MVNAPRGPLTIDHANLRPQIYYAQSSLASHHAARRMFEPTGRHYVILMRPANNHRAHKRTSVRHISGHIHIGHLGEPWRRIFRLVARARAIAANTVVDRRTVAGTHHTAWINGRERATISRLPLLH